VEVDEGGFVEFDVFEAVRGFLEIDLEVVRAFVCLDFEVV
jgi:hypothetical protein